MEHFRWTARPALRRPVVVVAFEGWNDAGDAATTAVRWLRDRLAPDEIAELDAEAFFDFTSTRPEVQIVDGARRIAWPSTTLSVGRLGDRDIVVILGTEPQLRWRTFCAAIVDAAKRLDAALVVTLGALIAEVPHTRPTSVMATSEDPLLGATYHVEQSSYEGPTGIVGVLHQASADAGLATMSLWAAVPAYVPGAPSPKAALAIVHRLGELMGLPLVTTDLEIASAAYERQVSDVVADDEEMTDYVARLELAYDEDDTAPAPTSLIREVEEFLRELPPG